MIKLKSLTGLPNPSSLRIQLDLVYWVVKCYTDRWRGGEARGILGGIELAQGL